MTGLGRSSWSREEYPVEKQLPPVYTTGQGQSDKREEHIVGKENPEYVEYLALAETYQGEKLKNLTKRVDWHVLPQLAFIYLLTHIDRNNVGNARLFGALEDMNLSSEMWNLSLSLFFITYAIGNPPFTMLLKRYGPRPVMSGILVTVAIVLVCSGCAGSIASWMPLRLLLGLFEAGVYPCSVFILTTWYTPSELHSRNTIFYCGASLSGAFSGLLAYGIGQLDYTWGYRGWRWIYVIEGVFSFVVGVGAYFVLQESPAKQGGWLRDEDRRFLVLRNRYAYGHDASGNSDKMKKKDIIAALKSIHVWAISTAYLAASLSVYGLTFTLPTIMSNMGFSRGKSQAVSAPPYVFATICIIISGWVSDRYRMRTLVAVVPAIMAWIGLLICVLTVTHKNLTALAYVGTCLAAGGAYCLNPAYASWVGLNSAGAGKRAIAISLAVLWAQIGGVAGSNIFMGKEAPGYHTGFGVCLAAVGFGNILVPCAYYLYIGHTNAKRGKMSEKEIYAKWTQKELREMGDLSPFYRYER
ncbi:hypothetical protein L198_08065 [Cryptococcus wingfieldii CBS 7118]|uniref:Major facilitator superfamily (MFS) profile domain-containing protein n=1 Tax=Cryptococcus wingfieldii CBS 7118 TaxID=1295528 RepID=A0A1E3HJE0_9TREE|nr:hypothetical protein L198_08065 [Cryptococcus wingfieldii CBS 7118]ODN76470.1 hypothetical protein L198_08065 [Cryptococcus wingfieldii CBS 7118]